MSDVERTLGRFPGVLVPAGRNREHRRGPLEESVFRALRLVLQQALRPLEPAPGHRHPQSGAEPNGQHHCHHRGPKDVAFLDKRGLRSLANDERVEWVPGPQQRFGERVEVVAAQDAVAVGDRQANNGVLSPTIRDYLAAQDDRAFIGPVGYTSGRHRVRHRVGFDRRPVQIGSLFEDRLL